MQEALASFKPGQWVDFHIPGLEHIGGFSITSTPLALKQSRTIELAVKRASYPPARWVHEQVGLHPCRSVFEHPSEIWRGQPVLSELHAWSSTGQFGQDDQQQIIGTCRSGDQAVACCEQKRRGQVMSLRNDPALIPGHHNVLQATHT